MSYKRTGVNTDLVVFFGFFRTVVIRDVVQDSVKRVDTSVLPFEESPGSLRRWTPRPTRGLSGRTNVRRQREDPVTEGSYLSR